MGQQNLPPMVPSDPSAADGAGGVKLLHAVEDFSRLDLLNSVLEPGDPIPGGHEVNADFTRDLVRLQWRMGDPIDVYVGLPAGVKNPPVALYLLNYPNGSERFLNPAFCRRLTQSGVAAVGFSTALTAERYAHRPMREWFVSELQESMASSTHDVQLVLDYMARRGDVDMGRVGIFGQGSGAAVAILAASVDPRIKALDLLEPWGDWPDWLAVSPIVPEEERPSFLKPEFLGKLGPVEPAHLLPTLKQADIRIQIVDDPSMERVNAALEMAAPKGSEVHHFATADQLRAANGSNLFTWLPEKLNKVLPLPVSTAADSSKGATP